MQMRWLYHAALYIMYPGAERLRKFPHHTGFGDDRLKLGLSAALMMAALPALPHEHPKITKANPAFAAPPSCPKARSTKWSQRRPRSAGNWAFTPLVTAIDTVAKAYHALTASPKQDHRWFISHFMLPTEQTMKTMASDGIWTTAATSPITLKDAIYRCWMANGWITSIPSPRPSPQGVNVVMSVTTSPSGQWSAYPRL